MMGTVQKYHSTSNPTSCLCMLQLIVFELAILIAVVGMLNKTPGNTNFAFGMTFVFIL